MKWSSVTRPPNSRFRRATSDFTWRWKRHSLFETERINFVRDVGAVPEVSLATLEGGFPLAHEPPLAIKVDQGASSTPWPIEGEMSRAVYGNRCCGEMKDMGWVQSVTVVGSIPDTRLP